MRILKLSVVSFVVMVLISCGNSDKQTAQSSDSIENSGDQVMGGKIEFVESEFDFGVVKEGEVVEHVYEFTNTGTTPIILGRVSASCGCTTPSYTQTPILPGKQGEVKVSFNSDGQVGKQQKIVTVVSNAENNITTIQLKGEVTPN
ncbi:DUF1573 domain-containing protein [Sphingobacterium shayense]|uniref:DUF1573 domain-containing protein n=1 Tax=Sphingobacterium shayense TaxID=626343 RepID=UPI001556E8DF|nr:DUF1573 domain-containing protein [Sphingobacterium shayense]NQD70580.1 DUF1573 domain-containing protein [Sphingobacterium shayense]